MSTTSQSDIRTVAQETFRSIFSFILPASNPNPESATRNISPTNSSLPSTAAYETYARHMLLMGHGHPLWIPGPNENLPVEYRKKGVTVGDVIVFTKDGAVDFAFNIFRPADDPINSNGVPDGFHPLRPLLLWNTRRYHQYGKDSYLASKSISKKVDQMGPSGTVFLSSAPEGAILMMPEGAYSEDISHLGLNEYLADNLESWYKYVNEVRGWGVEMGKLHLVTGAHKSVAWGIATFSNGPDAAEVRLRFNSKNEPPYGTLYSWEYDGESDCPRTGPTKEQKRSLWGIFSSAELDHPYENQCLFVRTINATLRSKDKATPQTEAIHTRITPSLPLGNRFAPQRVSSSSILQSAIYSVIIRSNLQNNLLSIPHPSEAINRSLLEMRPNARIVITHDQHWMSLLTEDDLVFPDENEILKRLKASYDIIEKNGIVSLRRSDPPEASSSNDTATAGTTPSSAPASYYDYTLKAPLVVNTRDFRYANNPPSPLESMQQSTQISRENPPRPFGSDQYADRPVLVLPSDTDNSRGPYIGSSSRRPDAMIIQPSASVTAGPHTYSSSPGPDHSPSPYYGRPRQTGVFGPAVVPHPDIYNSRGPFIGSSSGWPDATVTQPSMNMTAGPRTYPSSPGPEHSPSPYYERPRQSDFSPVAFESTYGYTPPGPYPDTYNLPGPFIGSSRRPDIPASMTAGPRTHSSSSVPEHPPPPYSEGPGQRDFSPMGSESTYGYTPTSSKDPNSKSNKPGGL